jgi:hypothetical protein
MPRIAKQSCGRKQNEHSELEIYKIHLLQEPRRAIQRSYQESLKIYLNEVQVTDAITEQV